MTLPMPERPQRQERPRWDRITLGDVLWILAAMIGLFIIAIVM